MQKYSCVDTTNSPGKLSIFFCFDSCSPITLLFTHYNLCNVALCASVIFILIFFAWAAMWRVVRPAR